MTKDRDTPQRSVHFMVALDEITGLPAGDAEPRLRSLLGLRPSVLLDSPVGDAAIRNLMVGRELPDGPGPYPRSQDGPSPLKRR